MMNKKRLAALAMSAVMAAGTVSIPVNAADFSDGAAVQEATAEAETLTVDVVEDETPAAGEDLSLVEGSIKWDMDKATVTYQATDNATGKTETRTIDAKKVETKASCEVGAGFYLEASILGQTYTSTTKETGDPLGHNWVKKEDVTKQATCTEDGEKTITTYCDRCNTVKETSTEPISAKGHDVRESEVTYECLKNTMLDDNGKVVLKDITKKGTYNEVKTGKCVVCGKEVVVKEEKTIQPEATVEGTSKIVKVENISAKETKAVVGADPKAKDFPSVDEIILDNCSKDGSYTVEVYDTHNKVIDEYTVTVPAHHTYGIPTAEAKNKDDAKYLAPARWDADKKELIVVNYTCLKDVEYNEVYTCASCDHKETVAKVAAKSDKHNVDAKAKAYVKGLSTAVEYSDLINNSLIKDNKYVKVVNETATCDKAGTVAVELYCQVCGEKVETISGVKVKKLGHNWVTKSENKVEATCENSGSYESVTACDRCGQEKSRKTITIKRLPHTNELETKLTGEGTPITDTIKGSEASIQFIGSLVFGDKDYKAGDKFNGGKDYTDKDGNVITSGTVKAVVITNCAVCHNNEVKLTVAPQDIKVKAVTKETRDVVTGKATAPGSITLVATYTDKNADVDKLTKEITLPYYSEPMDTTVGYTGLHKDVDGVYRYYVNGEFDEDYAGIVELDGNEFFVASGVLCKDAMGLNQNVDGKWYFLAYGQIQKGHAGLVEYDGAWFYVDDEGELKEEITGLVDYDGGTFLFINGRLAKEVNGLWQNSDSKWYFLANAQVQKQHTGLALYDGEWFYVVDGMLAEDFTGNVEYDGETFKVVNGMLR